MKENFIKCLNPRFVTNKYTGKTLLAECGKCEACLLKKSTVRTTLCKLESACHLYHYFVTLTYAPEYIPKVRLVLENSDFEKYSVVRESTGEYLGSVNFPRHIDKMILLKKCGQGINTLPVLEYSDVQLFLKRLRKYLKKFTNEKIRYFICGEYGPIHFRPHYHLSLWFDEEITSSVILQAIRSCWTLGVVDASQSRGKSCSYVASYVNSCQYLPRVFKLSGTSPFSHHSFYLGEQFYKDETERIQEIEFSKIARKRICKYGINTDIFLWRSLKNRLFPKLKGFANQSEHERVLTYSAYAIARDWTKETRPLDLAKFITDYVRYEDFFHPIDVVNDFLQLLRFGLNYYVVDNDKLRFVCPSLIDYDKFQRMVYMLLLQSRRFLRFQCGGDDSYYNVSKQIKRIEDFYAYLDSDALNKQLDMEKELAKCNRPAKFLFHNKLLLNEYKESEIYYTYKSVKLTEFSSFMKHKELNDKNKIFNY